MNAQASKKLPWEGVLLSVQPRIRLTRSFDERSHSDLGYALRDRGKMDGTEMDFSVSIGKAVQAKHRFRVGSGTGRRRFATAPRHARFIERALPARSPGGRG